MGYLNDLGDTIRKEKNYMERKNISIRTYKRKAQIWFGTEADSFSYDFVWHLPLQMCLDGEILNLKREGNVKVFLNNQIVSDNQMIIKNGDQIHIEDFTITFFKEKLEIEANAECFETSLLPERQEEEYFEGFPFTNVLQELYIREKRRRWKLKLLRERKRCQKGVWHS